MWLDVAKLSGILDISHKVAEITLQRISEKVWTMDTDDEQCLLVYLFQSLLTIQDLFDCWWDKFSSLIEVTDNFKLLATLYQD